MSNDLTVEVFAEGKWNGMDFDVADLDVIVKAFDAIGDNLQVPLKMGHNDEQPFTDGQPALGWVKDLWVEGNKLFAKFSDIPDIVYTAMKKKLYRNVSIELLDDVEYKGTDYSWVMTGVALLGADIPAVNVLADLNNYMSKITQGRKVVFTSRGTTKKTEDFKMSETEEVKALKTQIVAKDAEIEKLVFTNAALTREKVEFKAEMQALQSVEQHRKVTTERETLFTRLETMVKDKKITPFTRDDYLSDYDNDSGDGTVRNSVLFAVDKMEKAIDANPAYFGAEQARNKAKVIDIESSMSAGDVVVTRTREYMAKHGEKNFSIAKRAVLMADAELASRYTKMEA